MIVLVLCCSLFFYLFSVASHPEKTNLGNDFPAPEQPSCSLCLQKPCASRTEKTLSHPSSDTILKFMGISKPMGFMNTDVFIAYSIKSILFYPLPGFITGQI